MLASRSRLKTADLQKIFSTEASQKRLYKIGALWIFSLPNGLTYSRFGIVFSKKMFRTNVERNRCKRRLRTILFQQQPFIKAGFDIVLMAQRSIVSRSYADMKVDVISALRSARLFNQ